MGDEIGKGRTGAGGERGARMLEHGLERVQRESGRGLRLCVPSETSTREVTTCAGLCGYGSVRAGRTARLTPFRIAKSPHD